MQVLMIGSSGETNVKGFSLKCITPLPSARCFFPLCCFLKASGSICEAAGAGVGSLLGPLSSGSSSSTSSASSVSASSCAASGAVDCSAGSSLGFFTADVSGLSTASACRLLVL